MAAPRWAYHVAGDHPFHIWPLEDIVEHDHEDHDGGCVCGPTVEPVKCEDGSVGWIIAHHALDGRK